MKATRAPALAPVAPPARAGAAPLTVERLLTVAEVSALVRIRPAGVRTLANERAIGCVRLGRKILFRPADVERFIASRHLEPAAGRVSGRSGGC